MSVLVDSRVTKGSKIFEKSNTAYEINESIFNMFGWFSEKYFVWIQEFLEKTDLI